MFRQIIQSAINSELLKFAHAQENDQLKSIGIDDKKLQNWPASVSSCNNANIGEKDNYKYLSDDKGIVHELQVRIFSRMMSLAILREMLGASKCCPIGTTADYPHCLGDTGQTGWVNRSNQYWTGQTGCSNRSDRFWSRTPRKTKIRAS